jgi:transcriptional regulator with XRE-family HTH domain
MAQGEPPAVAKRRLRLALRRAREERKLTQGQVAKAMEWSPSKVLRIESGEVNVSPNDLRALLSFFEITDRTTVEQLVEDAKASRRQNWWAGPRYREHHNPATLELIQFEAEATAIRQYCPGLVPGLLQTADYARAVLQFHLAHKHIVLSETDLEVRYEARLQRRQQVLDRPDPPDYLVLLDESVLYRALGGPRVMGEQLLELLRFMDRPKVLVRIAPFADSAAIALAGPFIILDLAEDEDALLYRETHVGDEMVHSRHEIGRDRDMFEALWRVAMSDEESTRLIQERAGALLASSGADGSIPSG